MIILSIKLCERNYNDRSLPLKHSRFRCLRSISRAERADWNSETLGNNQDQFLFINVNHGGIFSAINWHSYPVHYLCLNAILFGWPWARSQNWMSLIDQISILLSCLCRNLVGTNQNKFHWRRSTNQIQAHRTRAKYSWHSRPCAFSRFLFRVLHSVRRFVPSTWENLLCFRF